MSTFAIFQPPFLWSSTALLPVYNWMGCRHLPRVFGVIVTCSPLTTVQTDREWKYHFTDPTCEVGKGVVKKKKEWMWYGGNGSCGSEVYHSSPLLIDLRLIDIYLPIYQTPQTRLVHLIRSLHALPYSYRMFHIVTRDWYYSLYCRDFATRVGIYVQCGALMHRSAAAEYMSESGI